MSVYDFKIKGIDGDEINLDQYKNKVLIIVNTASKCGFTPQYEGLETLYKDYKDKGFEVLGFPSNQFGDQEPGDNKEVKKFCELNYGVSFPLFEKIDVRGKTAHPLFNYLTEAEPFNGFGENGKSLNDFIEKTFPDFLVGDSIKWNFTKFLIDRNGNIVGRFEPTTSPIDMVNEIEKLL